MKKYVLGLDGGGTKSHFALFDTEGILIDFRLHGNLNHEMLPGSFTQLETELQSIITDLLHTNGIDFSMLSNAALGLSGVDTKKQHSIISDILKRIGLDNFFLCNDAYLGVFAGTANGVGICAINGTGASIAGVNASGDMLQIGGLGEFTKDMGGGAYMGTLAISAVYSSLYRNAEATMLRAPIFEALEISDKSEFTEAINEKITHGSLNVGMLNRLLFEAAAQGDNVSLDILSKIAENYSGGIAAMISELELERPVIVLAGSVFVRGEYPILIDMIKKNLSTFAPDYVLLKTPPVAGAILKALDMPGEDIRRVVCIALEAALANTKRSPNNETC